MPSTKAVILAAGRAIRMGDSSVEIPKSLMPLGPLTNSSSKQVSFIERQIALLKYFGVKDIYIVVHYLEEMFYKTLSDQVTFIRNEAEDIGQSGSLHSFQYAINSNHDLLNGDHHLLMMDADIVYEGVFLKHILSQLKRTNTIFISEMIHRDQEEVRVYGDPNHPRFIGKGFIDKQVGGAPCIGEATGVCHFHPEKHDLVRSIVDRLLGNPNAPKDSLQFRGFSSAKKMTEHEDLAQWLMMLNDMQAVTISKDMLFMEVDFEHEYHEVVNDLYPKVLNSDEKNNISPKY